MTISKPVKVPVGLPPAISATSANFDLAHRIIKGICKRHLLTTSQLLERDRRETRTWPRFMAMFLITEIAGLDQSEAAEVIGRHRTDVIHGIYRVIERGSHDAKFRQETRQWGKWAREQRTSATAKRGAKGDGN